MKKLFFAFAVAMLLLPATLWANTAKKKIKSVEITMDAPTPGMDLEDAEKLALKAVNTAYGDLFKSGVITRAKSHGTASSARTRRDTPH